MKTPFFNGQSPRLRKAHKKYGKGRKFSYSSFSSKMYSFPSTLRRKNSKVK
jgi:hypothetical protein